MHILMGAIIGCVVSVALTYAASKVINRPLTWKDVAASAAAGIIGGAVATATLGVGAATATRTVVAFSAGGATGSASGQITDNVLHGHPVQQDLAKSTALGTAIGAATFGVGKAAAPIAKHAGRLVGLGRGAGSAAHAAGHGGHGNALAGAAAGLDDAVVPVARYVKKALARDPVDGDPHAVASAQSDDAQTHADAQSAQADADAQSAQTDADAPTHADRGQEAEIGPPPAAQVVRGGMLEALEQLETPTDTEPAAQTEPQQAAASSPIDTPEQQRPAIDRALGE